MSCSHPILAISHGTTASGKKNLIFDWHGVPDDNGFVFDPRYGLKELIKIPCGQCVACRLAHSRMWADRCMLELQYHKHSWFVTLTYDDMHIPETFYGDPATGEAQRAYTLKKRDFQLFMKRLRKAYPENKIRFFMCGEYGETTHRPHYHAIIFGLDVDDLVHYKKSPQGFSYFNSPKLSQIWGNGHVVITEVSWDTCAYTARYVMKKLNGDMASFYSDFNLVPEFTLMSRKPGIARQYYEDHPDLFQYDYIDLKTEKGGKKIRPPRYYDMLFDHDNPEEFEKIKKQRKRIGKAATKAKLANTSLDERAYLEVEERNLIARTKVLKRSML